MTSDDSSSAQRCRRGQATPSTQPRSPSNRENRDASRSGDRVSESEVRVPSPTEGPGPSKAKVFKAFASWRSRGNPDAWVGTVDDWNINPYENTFVISSNGRRRSNRLHPIKGGKSIGFIPSMVSAETARRELVFGTDSHRHCKS